MPREERDSQRSRLYKADDVLKPFAKPLLTVKDMERFVRRVWSSNRLHKKYRVGSRLPVVKDGRGRRNAGGWSGGITMPLWARSTNVALHELAHTITQRHYGYTVAAHGWQYCGVFLQLVRWFIGKEAHDAFKLSMKQNKVRFTAPRQRKPITAEQREVLIARMALARAARKPKPSTIVLPVRTVTNTDDAIDRAIQAMRT